MEEELELEQVVQWPSNCQVFSLLVHIEQSREREGDEKGERESGNNFSQLPRTFPQAQVLDSNKSPLPVLSDFQLNYNFRTTECNFKINLFIGFLFGFSSFTFRAVSVCF